MTEVSPPPTTIILTLDDPAATEVAVAGGKAARLARLVHEGFRIPPGFVVTTRATALLADPSEAGVEASSLPDPVHAALVGALDALGPGPVAVRSSGVSEDAADASYAGRYETVLNVEGVDAVAAAIRTVLASAGGARLAVLVQRMVPADAAGIAFSANPVTGARDETLVSAVRGLGAALAAGERDPDDFVVRDGEVEVVARPENAIDVRQARQVADLADRLEALLGRPQDIEWAMADGTLWLLQSRPVTALPVPPATEIPDGTWAKDRAHYPEPVTPLGNAFLEALADASSRMCQEWGLMVDRIEQLSVGGEVYVRTPPIGGSASGPTPPWWLMAVLARVVPPMRRRLKAARERIESGALEAYPRCWEYEWKPEFRARIGRLRGVERTALTDAALAAHLDDALELMADGQRVHFRLFVPYAIGLHELVRETDRLLDWTPMETLELLQGLSAASAEAAEALHDLADLVRGQPAARELLDHPDDDLLPRLEAVDPEVADAVRTYRDDWGLRTVNYDPGAPTIAERPALLAGLLRGAIDRLEASPRGDIHTAREAAQERARRELDEGGVADEDRARFEEALSYAETVYPLREDNLFWTDNVPTALVRMAALEIGRRLADRGRIEGAEDAVWLEVAELKRELAGTSDPVLSETIERRKAERRWVRANPGPAVLGPEPSPPPDVRGLPGPARRTNGAIMWIMGLEGYTPEHDDATDADLAGVPASAGRHTGTVRVIRGEEDFHRLGPGDVLVAPITAPAWSVLFAQAGAVVTETGGVLSHAAIVAREHGIPAVLGVGGATTKLDDGAVVTVDGRAGTITVRDDPGARPAPLFSEPRGEP